MSVGPLGNTGGSIQSLWNNPQLLGKLFPGLNIAGMQGVLQAEEAQLLAPLQQLSQDSVRLSDEAQALVAIENAFSALQSAAQTLVNAAGAVPLSPAVSTNSLVATVEGTPTSAGTVQLTVSQLEANQLSVLSTPVGVSASSPAGWTGTVAVAVGGTTYSLSVTSGESLQTIAQNLTQLLSSVTGANVTAQAFSVPSGSGYESFLSVSGNTVFTVTLQGISDSFVTTQSYQPLVYSLNGFTVTASANQIAGVLPGVTVTALGLGTTEIGSTLNPSAAASQVAALVSAVTGLLATVGSYTGKGAPLEGQALLTNLATTLVDALLVSPAPLSGTSVPNLESVGLSVNWTQGGGLQLSFNPAAFAQAAAQAPTLVAALLGSSTFGIAGALLSTASLYSGTTGLISSLQNSLQQEQKLIQQQELALQQQVQMEQALLQSQFVHDLQFAVNQLSILNFLQSFQNQGKGAGGGGG